MARKKKADDSAEAGESVEIENEEIELDQSAESQDHPKYDKFKRGN
jgi:hypothetical protein